jgi:twitching motility protein PilJ
MPSGTDYTLIYGQAEKAYLQGNFEQAAQIIDQLAQEYPDDPTIILLRGHIYCYGLQEYEIARQQYELVLQLTDKPEFVDYAENGLEQTRQFQAQADSSDWPSADHEGDFPITEGFAYSSADHQWEESPGELEDYADWSEDSLSASDEVFDNPFGDGVESSFDPLSQELYEVESPFMDLPDHEPDWHSDDDRTDFPFIDLSDEEAEDEVNGLGDYQDNEEMTFVVSSGSREQSLRQPDSFEPDLEVDDLETDFDETEDYYSNQVRSTIGDVQETYLMSSEELYQDDLASTYEYEPDQSYNNRRSIPLARMVIIIKQKIIGTLSGQNGFAEDNHLEFHDFDDSFQTENFEDQIPF